MRDQLRILMDQRNAAEGRSSVGLSSTPNYIQHLERRIDTLEYKLDKILEKLDK